MQQIGKLLTSIKSKRKHHTDEVDDALFRLQDVIRMAALHNTAFYDGSIKESIKVTDKVKELLERLCTQLHYVRNSLEHLEEDAYCKRYFLFTLKDLTSRSYFRLPVLVVKLLQLETILGATSIA